MGVDTDTREFLVIHIIEKFVVSMKLSLYVTKFAVI